MKPADHRFFLREEEAPKEKNGIILVAKLQKEIIGEIVDTGKGVQFLKKGDRVQCARKDARLMEVNGEKLWCIMENPDRVLLLG